MEQSKSAAAGSTQGAQEHTGDVATELVVVAMDVEDEE